MDLFSTTACSGKNVKVRGEVVACTRRKRALFNRAMETIHTRGASSLSRADAVNRPTTATYSLGAPRLGHKRLVDPPVSYKFLEFEYNLFLIIIHPSPKTFIILVRHSSRSSSSRGHFYRPMIKGREREGMKRAEAKIGAPVLSVPRRFSRMDTQSAQKNESFFQCCSGFCIDLLQKFSEEIGFTYELVRVEDGKWGTLEVINYIYRSVQRNKRQSANAIDQRGVVIEERNILGKLK